VISGERERTPKVMSRFSLEVGKGKEKNEGLPIRKKVWDWTSRRQLKY